MRLIDRSDRLEVAHRELHELHRSLTDLEDVRGRRLADQLHDGPVQGLVATSMRLELLARGASNGAAPSPEDLSGIAGDVRATLEQLRSTIADLDPLEVCTGSGLEEGLRSLGRTLAAGVDLVLEIEGDCDPVPPEVCYSLLRIAAAALRNAVSHAQAKRVTLAVGLDACEVLMTVTDDGAGFDVSAGPAPGQTGLAVMRAEAAMVGGEVTVRSGAAGTRVTLRVPLGPQEASEAGLAGMDALPARCGGCPRQAGVASP